MASFSIAGLFWVVGFVAVGFAALRGANDFWLCASFLIMFSLLCGSVLCAVLERSQGGVWWLGFAVFGWAYLVAGLIPGLANPASIPSRNVAQAIFTFSHVAPQQHNVRSTLFGTPTSPYELRRENAASIGHWLFVLIFARAGATVSCVFTKGLPGRKKLDPEISATAVPPVP